MAIFIIKKFIIFLILLLGISFFAFLLLYALPGNPATSLIGQHSLPDDLIRINKALGADKSFISQYMGYLKLLLHGELGRSYYTNRAVRDDILQKFPNTLTLALWAICLAGTTGTILGLIAGIHKDTIVDKIINIVSLTGLSVPVFWSGLLLMLFFSFKLRILPPSGTGGIHFIVLPALTLTLPAMAGIVRITRASVLEIMGMPFMTVLTAKGLSRFRIYMLHLLKNVMIPLITIIALDFGSYLNGAVLTETIFGWDGIGRYAMEGILKRDYPVVLACVLVGTVVFVAVNTIVDILYKLIDPRIRIYKDNV